MDNKVIVGIDGGGTYTRVAITDADGNLLSYIEYKGGVARRKNPNPKANIFNAIQEALKKAGCDLSHVMGLAAGIAEYDSEEDLVWIRELTKIDGLQCPVQHINDSVVANAGAHLLKPGIIAISGTGSIILGISETGQHIRNYDFCHYAATAARFLSYDCVHQIIAGNAEHSDASLVNAALSHFGAEDVPALSKVGGEGFLRDRMERDKHFGDFAPVITTAALQGSRLAMFICNKAASDIVTGIRLVGSCFASGSVPVALIGSVVNCEFIKKEVDRLLLEERQNKHYCLVEPAVPPAFGAVIIAMQLCGINLSEKVLARVCSHYGE
ncbi:MAG: hypothetical protein FWE42_07110 [Defluviitaleaceae bacterium]|nr:hypothetical protein [Defluviitaleaceae bacterium]